jgi:hypothetical protein
MPQLNTLSVLDNLEITQLTDWNDVSRVRKISKGCKFMEDVESLNIGFGAMASKSLDVREYRESYIGDDERVAEVQNIAPIGNTVVIDLQPLNGNPVTFYRVGDLIFGDREQIQGIVTAVAPGQVVIEPFAGSTVATLVGSINIGNNIQTIGNRLPDRNSSRVADLNRVAEIQLNFLSLMRDGSSWNRIDMHKARIKSAGKYWSSGQIADALDRMLKDIERSWFWGLPQNPINNNDVGSNGGVDWAIRNRGGEVVSFGALPTKGQFMEWLGNVYDKRPSYNKLKKLYIGRKLYQHIQDQFGDPNFVKQIDAMSPRTGAQDENFNRWLVGGFEVDLVTNLPMMQERDYRTVATGIPNATGMRKEWSCYLIDQDPIAIEGGNGTVPAIEKLHFGDSPFYIGRSTGIGDCPVGMPTAEGQLGNPESYMVATSAVDRTELNFMYHGGVNMITGEFSGIFEAGF